MADVMVTIFFTSNSQPVLYTSINKFLKLKLLSEDFTIKFANSIQSLLFLSSSTIALHFVTKFVTNELSFYLFYIFPRSCKNSEWRKEFSKRECAKKFHYQSSNNCNFAASQSRLAERQKIHLAGWLHSSGQVGEPWNTGHAIFPTTKPERSRNLVVSITGPSTFRIGEQISMDGSGGTRYRASRPETAMDQAGATRDECKRGSESELVSGNLY